MPVMNMLGDVLFSEALCFFSGLGLKEVAEAFYWPQANKDLHADEDFAQGWVWDVHVGFVSLWANFICFRLGTQ